jgi:hypothetical protein
VYAANGQGNACSISESSCAFAKPAANEASAIKFCSAWSDRPARRGQRGTEDIMGAPTLAGARVVVLDETLAPLPGL